MNTYKEIVKRDDLYEVIREEKRTLAINGDMYLVDIYYDYKLDFSEVRENSGILGKIKEEWTPVSETEQTNLKNEFIEINKKVKIHLAIESSNPYRTTYSKWVESIGNLVNNKTGTIEKIQTNKRNKPRKYLVKLDEGFLDPNFKTNTIQYYHFDDDEVIFL